MERKLLKQVSEIGATEEKPLISRIPHSNEIFEFNKPSKFLYMFTGVKPIVINENGISITLIKYQNAIENIFKRIAEDNNSCFVAGTAITTLEFVNFHCYPIVATAKYLINKQQYHVNLYDTREQTIIERHSNSFINNVKYICGYFEEMLK